MHGRRRLQGALLWRTGVCCAGSTRCLSQPPADGPLLTLLLCSLPPFPLAPGRWGAFALALILSLGSAIPIVYICRLPDCLKFLSRPY